ncbi:DNA binding domain, excisionase family [Bacteroides sp. 2_1_33B]|jgi:excisionase family DNA binding protein|nr:DNA binding domain, excisionase family [Bacteroides sp. 2_1_33B]
MDILDNKSQQIGTFFTTLDELSNTIQQALQNRTPHLNGEKYLTNREVCQLLRISSRTLQNWRDTGKIPFIKLKRKILYRESVVKKRLE